MLNLAKRDMNEDILRIACGHIDIDFNDLLFLNDVDNFVYLFKKDKEYILRFTHSSHKSIEQINSELEFLEYLSRSGVSVNIPVPFISGNRVEVIPFEDRYFSVCYFEKVAGEQFNHMNDKFIYKLGKNTGRLHLLSKTYKPYLKRVEWYEDIFLEDSLNFEDISKVLNKVIIEIKRRPVNKDNYGLIHTSLVGDNIIVKDSELSILNFNNCKFMHFIYDIAVVLFELFVVENPNQSVKTIEHFYELFMEGYNTENILPSEEFYYMELFLELKRIETYVECITNYNDESRPKWAKDYIDINKKRINERDHIIHLEFRR